MNNIMYNQNIKESFLSDFPLNTQSTYRRIFIRSMGVEEVLGKDLYDFTKHEIEEVLFDLNPLTPAVSQSNGRIISSYISWWIEKNKSQSINPLNTVGAEWFNKFIDKNKKLYYSYKDIKQIEDFCMNAQDAVIVRLYFEGVAGMDSAEIRNLSKNDIHSDINTLILRDANKTPRAYKVSHDCIKLVNDALAERTYMKRNGLMVEQENVRTFTDLVNNDYVIRNSITRTDLADEAVHSSVIYRRMKMISELMQLPYLTGKNVFRSGIIYYAWQILNEEGVLGKPQYEKIAERFQIKNWYSIKEYCTEEIIFKLYGEVAATISA